MRARQWLAVPAVASLAVADAARPVLAALARNAKGGYDFAPAAVPALAEAAKLALSLGQLAAAGPLPSDVPTAAGIARTAMLAAAYALNNNLLFVAARAADPATVQLLGGLKVPLAASLMAAAGRDFSRRQLGGLVLLCVGTALAHSEGAIGPAAAAIASHPARAPFSASPAGWAALAASIIVSAAAGVYNELLLKHSPQSPHAQNAQLYALGTLLTWLPLLSMSHVPVAGFNRAAWLLVLCLAVLGQLTAAVLRLGDNVWKAFAAAGSLLISGVASWVWFGRALGPGFVLGCAANGVASYLYSVGGTEPWPAQAEGGIQPRPRLHTTLRWLVAESASDGSKSDVEEL
ncbi:nucleotide-sugar transporter-domain-containing protein [Hyaloraphidium curvatum]|nr:nucleotide-sugar transporter-domain-containing protein [Hyaloraphidium curvatum]